MLTRISILFIVEVSSLTFVAIQRDELSSDVTFLSHCI
jgi:hypothetical protein